MTAKEVYALTLQKPEVLIVYKTEEWHQMMLTELRETTNNLDNYHFVSESEASNYRGDYVIAESSIPQYILKPLLKSHFFHDNKSPTKNPS